MVRHSDMSMDGCSTRHSNGRRRDKPGEHLTLYVGHPMLRLDDEPSALKQLVERDDLRPEQVAPINPERPEFLLVHPAFYLELRQPAADDE